MVGDDRVRHCAECQLDVYNFSAMSEREAETLVAKSAATGSRLCARFYQRADGTVITQDCPVGFRARVKKVTRRAAAVLAAAMSPVWAFAQQKAEAPKAGSKLTQIQETDALEVTVRDVTGAVIPNADVNLFDKSGKSVASGVTGSNGTWRAAAVPIGAYTLKAESRFFRLATEQVIISGSELLLVDVTLEVGKLMGEVVEVQMGPGAALKASAAGSTQPLQAVEKGTVRIVVKDPTGAVVSGAEMSLLDQENRTVSSGKAGKNGVWLSTGLRPGIYTVKAESKGLATRRELVTITEGKRTIVEVRMSNYPPFGATVLQGFVPPSNRLHMYDAGVSETPPK